MFTIIWLRPRGLIQSVIRRYCSVMCNSCRAEVCFKLDTGADVTVISQSDYRRAVSTKRLVGANDNVLQPLGMFIGRLSQGGAVVNEDIYVISGQRRSLLSRRAC